ncbi:PTS lactose/cellobiose transporter subunit IIA [Clostridium saccharobutylicum]|uniref:Phosphotransferase system enzyme II PtcA n=1 Tax=Clostridium saccharobutylicum DSM 13864 TaxID=1345695 RepID=U5MQR6_CLOSA|nr:PTS lactose/cellobiose transporter subunit IIA [Clostridium saccharobutylicum]AGX42006.1 phosphotransferase system enzyme II PtcA [Clostridium saccharobutylicum DSM 13864]AQR89284.1 oligo-beta-mannoside-specific phosphotransferase enzyme IIA component [Clostridium saccharobutylicum]AQR99185.1 oligo-beta-mannoside-specific phosphotransferase enzyme IIA component [Clostridium saccharobutylicum]AQS08917.1 oligo-beta-mannoside-specific phosphotransferase enzyme IIA component [Clostridium sacchar
MEGIELIAFEIISNVGMAKSLALEALRDVREGKYDEAEKKMSEASDYIVKGHHAHASLIQKEAAGEKVEFSLIIMHAEDQMMAAETIKSLIEEMIEVFKELKK